MEKVRDEGVYLLENGIHVLLFVGLAVDPQWIQVCNKSTCIVSSHNTCTCVEKIHSFDISKSQDVFGVATAAQIDIDKTKLVERDNPLSRRVSFVIMSKSQHFLKIQSFSNPGL